MDKSVIKNLLNGLKEFVVEFENGIDEVEEELAKNPETNCNSKNTNVFHMSLANVDRLIDCGMSNLVFNPGDVIISGKLQFKVIDVGNMTPVNAKPGKKHVLLRVEQYITEITPFDTNANQDWEKSSIRKFLNGEFFNTLPYEDRSAIKYVNLHTGKADIVTMDHVFLLSAKELGFGGDEAGEALPFFTGEDGASNRVYEDKTGSRRIYFTRSPHPMYARHVCYVHINGSLDYDYARGGYAAIPACILI